MKNKIFGCILAATLCAAPATAQLNITNDQAPVLLAAYNTRNVSWKAQVITIPLQKNMDDAVEVQASASWLQPYVDGNKVMVTVLINGNLDPRTATVTIKCGDIAKEVAIVQEASKMMDEVESKNDFGIFADPLCTQLREGITQDDIDNVPNLFVRLLAQKIFDGTYDTKYRTGTYKCITSPSQLKRIMGNAYAYDEVQGVTGIMVHPGRFIVAVDGLPEDGNYTAKISVYTWTVPDGERLKTTSAKLKNGINFIDNTMSTDGLVYISYYADDPTPFENSPISIHIMDGIQNGYIDNTMTNEECHEVCTNARYATVDCVGERVHSVWEAEAMTKYIPGRYRKMMNMLDTLVAWEQRLIGVEKYNLVKDNKTLGYVNYNYFMYCGGYGATFHYDQQQYVIDPDKMVNEGAGWGVSHEWGHQHQVRPYFCWAGMTETTNNINSVYNCLHLGYRLNSLHRELGKIRDNFITGSLTGKSTSRHNAYVNRDRYSWNPKMYAMCESMVDSMMHDRNENFERASTTQENYPNSYSMFWMIHEYMTKHVYADYTPDLYQAMRTTETRDDKYAILAAAQNLVSGKWAEYKQKYPESVWVKDNYIRTYGNVWDNSVPFIFNFIMQSSILSGYNMYDVYDQLGFIRTIAMGVDDYGMKYYVMTPEMKAEFKADMDALQADGTLKPLPEGIVEEILKDENITHYPHPVFPN